MVRYDTGLPPGPALQLQRCRDCGQLNYPRRELCGRCLADALEWHPVPPGGKVQSLTRLHASLEPLFAQRLPWSIASLRLDCGPVVFAHLQAGLDIDARVQLAIARDPAGNRVLVALAENDGTRARAWLQQAGFEEESV